MGGGVKGQNAKGRFERKMNAGFVLSGSELVEKHSSPKILTYFQHEKKLQFCSKKVNFKQGGNFHINTEQQFMTKELRNFLYGVSYLNMDPLQPVTIQFIPSPCMYV